MSRLSRTAPIPRVWRRYVRIIALLTLTLTWSVEVCAQASAQEQYLERYLGKMADLPACAHTTEESPFREGVYFPIGLTTQGQQEAALAAGDLKGLDPPPYIEIAPDRLSCPGKPEVRTMFGNFASDGARPNFPAFQIPCYTEKGLRIRVASHVKRTCEATQEDEDYVTLHFVQKQDPLRLECDDCAARAVPKTWIYAGKRKAFPGDMSVLKALREYLGPPNLEESE